MWARESPSRPLPTQTEVLPVAASEQLLIMPIEPRETFVRTWLVGKDGIWSETERDAFYIEPHGVGVICAPFTGRLVIITDRKARIRIATVPCMLEQEK